MTPMLGIMASAISGNLSSYESISTVTVGSGGVSSVSFTSIPATYNHLQIRALTRGTYAAAGLSTLLNLNSTGTSGYRHHLYGNGSTATGYSTTSYGTIGGEPGSTIAANIMGALVMDILDYTSTTKTKTLRYLSGFDANGSGEVMLGSAYTSVTNAISSITLTTDGDFTQYSHFALYGAK